MDVIARLKRELAFNVWANREMMGSLHAAKQIPARAMEVLGHMIAAENLWLKRMGKAGPDILVWPTLSLADCDKQMSLLSQRWKSLAEELTISDLEKRIQYVNSKGETWENSVIDILTHVVIHAGYHRGQIASFLGRSGEKAALTDYIECSRRGYVDTGWPE